MMQAVASTWMQYTGMLILLTKNLLRGPTLMMVRMHTVSMLYTFILWAVLGGLLAIFVFSRAIKPSRTRSPRLELEGGRSVAPMSIFTRFWKSKTAALRRLLLPESLQSVFGNVTRLQLVLLAVLSGCLLIFS